MVSRYAVIRGGVCTNVVLWDGTESWTPPTDAQLVPYDPASHVINVPVDVQNARTLRDKAAQALTANATFLGTAKPGTAATQASAAYDQAVKLTRQADAIIRLLVVNDTSTITDS